MYHIDMSCDVGVNLLTVNQCIISQNGGSNCPACRGVSTSVTPSRPLQTIIDVLLRAYPAKARTERERQQADEVYKPGTSLRVSAAA
jgi:E3 ubiquitin-protein ligase CHFR